MFITSGCNLGVKSQLRGFLAKRPNYEIIVLSYSIKTEFNYSDGSECIELCMTSLNMSTWIISQVISKFSCIATVATVKIRFVVRPFCKKTGVVRPFCMET